MSKIKEEDIIALQKISGIKVVRARKGKNIIGYGITFEKHPEINEQVKDEIYNVFNKIVETQELKEYKRLREKYGELYIAGINYK